jgi:hypothetical protein
MVIVIPYPNSEKYYSVEAKKEHHETIFAYRKEILDYVGMVCTGPWQSNELDIMYKGIRVRLGNKKDLMFLQLKYGATNVY